MTTIKRVFTAVGLLGTTLLSITACASATLQAGAPSAARVGTGRAAYTKILEQVYGTLAQREAAEERAWINAQAAMSACVAKTSSTYGITPYPGGLSSTHPAPGDLLAFAPAREDFGVASRLTAKADKAERTNPGLAAATTDAEKKQFFKDLQGCQKAAVPFEGTNMPARAEALIPKLLSTLERVQKQATPTLRADYGRCLKEAGINAADRPELYALVDNAFPSVPAGHGDPANLPGWGQAVAFERQAAATDAACRADAVEVAMAAAPAELEKFSKANAADLATASAGWAQAETDVKALRARYKLG